MRFSPEMRPLVFLNHPLETFTPTKSGAIATVIWECCQKALESGVEPWVITRQCVTPPFPWPRKILVDYPPVPTGRIGRFAAKAIRKISGWRHLNEGAYTRAVARAIRRHGLSEGTFVVSNDPEWVLDLRKHFPKAQLIHWFHNQLDTRKRYRGRFARAADQILACSQFTASWIEECYGLTQGRVRVVYNAVDSVHFAPAAPSAAPSVPVLNFVGRTGIEKAPDLFLKAALGLASRGYHFDVQIIGSNHWDRYEEDDYQRELNSLIKQLEGFGVAVRRTGHVGRGKLPDELRQAHIHIVPARWDEPFGLTTLEGMASGLATVASATGGTPEVVGDSGLLFSRESVEELTVCVAKLLDDPMLRIDLGRRARSRAEQFSWSRTWSSLSGLICPA